VVAFPFGRLGLAPVPAASRTGPCSVSARLRVRLTPRRQDRYEPAAEGSRPLRARPPAVFCAETPMQGTGNTRIDAAGARVAAR
jgi:hypothetical protein